MSMMRENYKQVLVDFFNGISYKINRHNTRGTNFLNIAKQNTSHTREHSDYLPFR